MDSELMEVMKARHSVRTYEKKEIANELIEKINHYIEKIEDSYQVKIKLVKQGFGNGSVKLGTYGVIQGASYFLVAACKNTKEGHQALGFAMEEVILFCTSLGLGTCWMGGTFSKGSFAKVMPLEDNEVTAIVSPLGWEAKKNSFLGSIMSQKGKRNDFEKSFFLHDFSTPLTRQEAKKYETVLEMVRIAPSALNKQPWRIVKDENRFHFYLDGKAMMQQIDMGIAMCHFKEAAKDSGCKGRFIKEQPDMQTKLEYICTWIEEK